MHTILRMPFLHHILNDKGHLLIKHVPKNVTIKQIIYLSAAGTVELKPVLPDFSAVQIQDIFKSLVWINNLPCNHCWLTFCLITQGPLPAFSGDHSWSKPRSIVLSKQKGGFGFTIKGSMPVKISGVDSGKSADVSAMVMQLPVTR